MDLYCRICHEPWDNDSLHDEVEARLARKADNESYGASFTLGTTYDDVAADFRERGCHALVNGFGSQSHCKPASNPERSAIIEAAYDLCGDDMDGAMSLMDDFL